MTRIEDYLLLGDLHTSALVSKQGSIDWLCAPRFDSPSLFARVLDEQQGGRFAVEPAGYAIEADYAGETAIARLRFASDRHTFELHDFMPPKTLVGDDAHWLVRRFAGVKGSGTVEVRFDPRPDYARQSLKLEHVEHRLTGTLPDGLPLNLHLPANAEVNWEDTTALIRFPLATGENADLRLGIGPYTETAPNSAELEENTRRFWQDWLKQGKFFAFCEDRMKRSAITLKLMQYLPSGGLIAAPTTSLPETLGGIRNWDYRYVWIRDATFTLYAFHVLGYHDTLDLFFDYIEHIVDRCKAEEKSFQLMYTVTGEEIPKEEELTHLSGYENSAPVRIGNGASEQLQLDVFGSMIDAYYFMWENENRLTDKAREVILHLTEEIARHWMRKDHGIWEVRDGQQHYTYCKVMCWVGIDRALRMKSVLKLSKARIDELKLLRKEIQTWIWDNCYDSEQETFTQHPETKHVDAVTLLFPLLQFLDRHDPQTNTILENTAKQLVHDDLFLDRYHIDDNLSGEEGSFLLCTFWWISSLAEVGEHERARQMFDRLEAMMDESFLLSEEIDPATHRYLGNFPQAFSHMGYVMAAYYLDRYTDE